jgi:hypothetical protein
LYAKGFVCDADTCSAAAEIGHLETLAWVVEQLSARDVPLPDTLLFDACMSGNVDTFRDVCFRRPYRLGRLSWTSHPDSSAYNLFLEAPQSRKEWTSAVGLLACFTDDRERNALPRTLGSPP